MKKLLIALDHDPSAQKIAEKGYELAKALKAQTFLLHVTSQASYSSSLNYSPVMGFGIFSNDDIVEKDPTFELKKLAQSFLENSKEQLGDETIQTIVENGDIAENIMAVASELQMDMIVMGTHSRGGLKRVILGSVAEKVLHHSSIPLFVIPIDAK